MNQEIEKSKEKEYVYVAGVQLDLGKTNASYIVRVACFRSLPSVNTLFETIGGLTDCKELEVAFKVIGVFVENTSEWVTEEMFEECPVRIIDMLAARITISKTAINP